VKTDQEEPNELCKSSLGILGRDNPIRKSALYITNFRWFERAVLLAIVSTSVILAMEKYYPGEENSWQNKLQRLTDLPFTILFALECAIKVAAVGFVKGPKSYMRDAWNWLDFLVVISGLISAVSGGGQDFVFLRTIRVLRPLRTLSAMPGMRKLVNTIFLSLPGLKDVILLAVFFHVTFGILGLHFWGGVLHRRCRITPQPLNFSPTLGRACRGWCFHLRALLGTSIRQDWQSCHDAGWCGNQ